MNAMLMNTPRPAAPAPGAVVADASPAARILWYDPDAAGLRMAIQALQRQGHTVRRVGVWQEAKRALQENGADLIILESDLADEDGLGVCQTLSQTCDAPILIYSARAEPLDRVAGLEFGADDYLGKDTHGLELLARVKALLRRTGRRRGADTLGAPAAGWRYDAAGRILTGPRGRTLRLRPAPAALLELFLMEPDRLFTREDLAARLLGEGQRLTDRLIDVRVSRLRRALNACEGAGALIRTERGTGYIFEAPGSGGISPA